jgi:hypothetical protein
MSPAPLHCRTLAGGPRLGMLLLAIGVALDGGAHSEAVGVPALMAAWAVANTADGRRSADRAKQRGRWPARQEQSLKLVVIEAVQKHIGHDGPIDNVKLIRKVEVRGARSPLRCGATIKIQMPKSTRPSFAPCPRTRRLPRAIARS